MLLDRDGIATEPGGSAAVRFYDPATGTFLTRDPAGAMTRSAYGYVNGNPLNGTDPSGLRSVSIPKWVSPVAAAVGIDCIGTDCESIAEQHPKIAQGVADVAGGTLDGLSMGNARNVGFIGGQRAVGIW